MGLCYTAVGFRDYPGPKVWIESEARIGNLFVSAARTRKSKKKIISDCTDPSLVGRPVIALEIRIVSVKSFAR